MAFNISIVLVKTFTSILLMEFFKNKIKNKVKYLTAYFEHVNKKGIYFFYTLSNLR